ncbi:exonuclease SbcCD subunit D [Methanobrevibacter sp.]|uniref:metallophosphoesterase family protein n=1 Tax=Methanobrevibacter sp. TaxID=66852 RepID=UPI00388EA069
MRFAHLSDTHLGNRQYGIFEREEDYYEIFDKTIDKIIESGVDFVIHSGDLFDSQRPSTNALLAFQKNLLKLNNAGIPMYAIPGNHDIIMRKGIKPPVDLFEDLGLKVLRYNNDFMEGDIYICGFQYIPSSQKAALEMFLENFSNKAQNHQKSIIVLHQAIKTFLDKEDAYELEFSELPDNFTYYAMGHLHPYIEADYGKGKLIYPGSMEINRSKEIAQSDNKGFCIVDMSGDKPVVERVKVDLERKQFAVNIKYEELHDKLAYLKDYIKDLDKKPLIIVSVFGGNAVNSDVHEFIQDQLSDYTLNLRISYTPENELKSGNLPSGDILEPKSFLKHKISEKYGDEAIANLSVDLLENLSRNRVDDARFLSDDYFNNHYPFEDEEVGQ